MYIKKYPLLALQTVFYFDIKKEFLRGGLDRLAQFFVHPLMKRSSMDREIEAVDSGRQ